jgi:hypothetical protein
MIIISTPLFLQTAVLVILVVNLALFANDRMNAQKKKTDLIGL